METTRAIHAKTVMKNKGLESKFPYMLATRKMHAKYVIKCVTLVGAKGSHRVVKSNYGIYVYS